MLLNSEVKITFFVKWKSFCVHLVRKCSIFFRLIVWGYFMVLCWSAYHKHCIFAWIMIKERGLTSKSYFFDVLVCFNLCQIQQNWKHGKNFMKKASAPLDENFYCHWCTLYVQIIVFVIVMFHIHIIYLESLLLCVKKRYIYFPKKMDHRFVRWLYSTCLYVFSM